ncbi:MAG: preprotein translocase subunit YajC [Clostridia bacterium]|nr:preprotein translocase subunit YajC [Clostridia bacterium]
MFSFLLNADAGTQGNSWMTIVMLILVVVVFYFFLIRPQKKQEKEAANMRNSLEVGDEIVTIGGIVGQVVNVKGETITIVTGKDRVKIRFLKTAVREVTVKANQLDEDEKAPASPTIEPAKEKKDDAKEAPAAEATEETKE